MAKNKPLLVSNMNEPEMEEEKKEEPVERAPRQRPNLYNARVIVA